MSGDTFNALIKAQSIRAMQHLMLHEKMNYRKEVNELAETCSNVLQQHTNSVDVIVQLMETSMTSNYLQTLKTVQNVLELCQEERGKTVANSFYGGRESDRLAKRITALEKSKTMSPLDIMDQIVNDVLIEASIKYDSANP
ncbi:hypothetical protein [Legionella hackeliae]|uniref:Uncharacterized protein n=1 Tax=Legionella hackeliae TaxID=449 RepID=A0A0A8UPC9_LEGHA|nr:hypothetical protein [Legionella hackeliae]KTD13885.1 hypothetical protein Lhac_0729 [Legionella hackeliae]CEK10588.1 protein of unknown function [Legionella hackeliae]STX47330.1 Uncharacterised protein [Legionella hackeliae]